MPAGAVFVDRATRTRMPIPPVVVELPPDTAAHEAAVLIEACKSPYPSGVANSRVARSAASRGAVLPWSGVEASESSSSSSVCAAIEKYAGCCASSTFERTIPKRSAGAPWVWSSARWWVRRRAKATPAPRSGSAQELRRAPVEATAPREARAPSFENGERRSAWTPCPARPSSGGPGALEPALARTIGWASHRSFCTSASAIERCPRIQRVCPWNWASAEAGAGAHGT